MTPVGPASPKPRPKRRGASVKPALLNEEMRRAAAIKWYELRKISQGKGAEICGVTRAEFLKTLSDYQVSILQDDDESLQKELSD